MWTFTSLCIRFEYVVVVKLPNRRIIRRKIRSCDSGIITYFKLWNCLHTPEFKYCVYALVIYIPLFKRWLWTLNVLVGNAFSDNFDILVKCTVYNEIFPILPIPKPFLPSKCDVLLYQIELLFSVIFEQTHKNHMKK